jgi:hypothetical protein
MILAPREDIVRSTVTKVVILSSRVDCVALRLTNLSLPRVPLTLF